MSKLSLQELLDNEDNDISKYQIYCDLDGVLCDFENRFLSLIKKEGPKYYSKDVVNKVDTVDDFIELEGENEFWRFIDEYIGTEFWSEMDWMQNGEALWSFISDYNPIILTSPSDNQVSKLGKRLWVQNNLTDNPKIIFKKGKDKSDLASPHSILIDDTDDNLTSFDNKGGIAIKCSKGNIAPVIKRLKQIGYGR